MYIILCMSEIIFEVGIGEEPCPKRSWQWQFPAVKTLTAPIGLSSFFTIVFDLCILIYLHVCITDYIRELLLFFRCLSTSCNIASRGFTPSYTALVILLKLYPLVVLSMFDVNVLHVCILLYACLKLYLKLALARSRVLREVGSGSSQS